MDYTNCFNDLLTYLAISKGVGGNTYYMHCFNSTKTEMEMMKNFEIHEALKSSGYNIEVENVDGITQYKISW